MAERELFQGESIRVSEYLCSARRRETAHVETTTEHEIAFVRRGMFVLETSDGENVVTPNHAMMFVPGEPYRIQHPLDGGDECLIISGPFEEALGKCRRIGVRIAGASAFLAQQRLVLAVRRGERNDIEHHALGLLATVVPSVAPRRSHRHMKGIRRVQELLSVHYAEPLPLSLLASEADLSPWQLSRAFHHVTGCSLHRYQNSLRLRAAVRRLGEGENNLSALALDLGYCDHSHFTTAFTREFGVPPSRIRERQTHSG
jgi:AraC-like DNA-binding protein